MLQAQRFQSCASRRPPRIGVSRPIKSLVKSRRPIAVSASHISAATSAHDAHKKDHAEHHDDGALSLLNYAAAFGEALSSTLPASAVQACYAISVGHVLYETLEKCHEAHSNWSKEAAVQGCEVLSTDTQAQHRVEGARAGRRELQRGMMKLIGTVALPSLVMHVATHCGWDMLNDVSGVSDALSAVAGQMAHALHIPQESLQEVLGKGLPQVAGSFLIPFIARPAEQLLDKFMDSTLRPAIDEFCGSARSFTGSAMAAAGQSFTLAAGASFSRNALARSFVQAGGRSFSVV